MFGLSPADGIAEGIAGARLVLNCAGPFSATAVPLMEACLAARSHYLDITGEIGVIEAAAERHERARSAGVAIIPAVGFDVVPTDCLAAHLAERLPGASHLAIAFHATGGLSPGTAKTSLEALGGGGRARIDGRITRVPIAWKSLEVPFAKRTRWAMTIPWGDVASAYHSTGIPNIETYLALPKARIQQARRLRVLAPLLRFGPLLRLAQGLVQRRVKGPAPEVREASRASFWGRVSHDSGETAEATLETPGGYQITLLTALAAVDRVLAGSGAALHGQDALATVGFATPSMAFGKEFILEFPGTALAWRT